MNGHEHVPVIVHRTGGPLAEELNRCGVCGQQIIKKMDGEWEIAASEEFWVRRIVQRVLATDGAEEITLECGHSLIRIIPQPRAAMAYCPECLHDFVRQAKTKDDARGR
jgi:hypothetical protein